eukprot:m51a1_g2720 hypothetical protein (186) ;mRNA; r:851111-852191
MSWGEIAELDDLEDDLGQLSLGPGGPEESSLRDGAEAGAPTAHGGEAQQDPRSRAIEVTGLDESVTQDEIDGFMGEYRNHGFMCDRVSPSICVIVFRSSAYAADALERLRTNAKNDWVLRPCSKENGPVAERLSNELGTRGAVVTGVARRLIGAALGMSGQATRSPIAKSVDTITRSQYQSGGDV